MKLTNSKLVKPAELQGKQECEYNLTEHTSVINSASGAVVKLNTSAVSLTLLLPIQYKKFHVAAVLRNLYHQFL